MSKGSKGGGSKGSGGSRTGGRSKGGSEDGLLKLAIHPEEIVTTLHQENRRAFNSRLFSVECY